MSLDEKFYSCYPDDEDSFYLKHGEHPIDASSKANAQTSQKSSTIVHFLEKKEIDEHDHLIVQEDFQPALLSKLIKNRWSWTKNRSVFLGDSARLLGRKLAKWEGRALLFLAKNSFKPKRKRNTKFEPLPRWIIPVKDFATLLDLLSQCGINLSCRTLNGEDFLIDLLDQSSREVCVITQEEIKSLLTFLLPRGFRVNGSGKYLLPHFFSKNWVCRERCTPTTVDIVRILVESVGEVEDASKLVSDKIRSIDDIDILKLLFQNVPLRSNEHTVPIVELLVNNGCCSFKEIEAFFLREPFEACFYSEESLQCILRVSHFLRKHLQRKQKRKLDQTSLFWNVFRSYYTSPKKSVSMISFVDCGIKLNILIRRKTAEVILLNAVCRYCGCEALPELLQLFWEHDKSIHSRVIYQDLNSLQMLSSNEKILGQPVYDAVRKLIELGAVVKDGANNPILLFLLTGLSSLSECCCDYGRRLELSISPFFDTVELIIDAAAAQKADKNYQEPEPVVSVFTKFLIFNILTGLCCRNPPCSDCARPLSSRSPLRRECFSRFLRFVAKLVRSDLTRNAFTHVERNLCITVVCEAYEDEEREAMRSVLCEHWLDMQRGLSTALQPGLALSGYFCTVL